MCCKAGRRRLAWPSGLATLGSQKLQVKRQWDNDTITSGLYHLGDLGCWGRVVGTSRRRRSSIVDKAGISHTSS